MPLPNVSIVVETSVWAENSDLLNDEKYDWPSVLLNQTSITFYSFNVTSHVEQKVSLSLDAPVENQTRWFKNIVKRSISMTTLILTPALLASFVYHFHYFITYVPTSNNW